MNDEIHSSCFRRQFTCGARSALPNAIRNAFHIFFRPAVVDRDADGAREMIERLGQHVWRVTLTPAGFGCVQRIERRMMRGAALH